MKARALPLVLAVTLPVMAAGIAAARDSGPDAAQPLKVGEIRVAASALGARAPMQIADQTIHRLWLEAEAKALRVPVENVADAIAGKRRGTAFAAAFDALHERQRARTRCLATIADPYMGRCSNQPKGICTWMGAATVCSAGSRWVMFTTSGKHVRSRRTATRAGAVRLAFAVYTRARTAREREARAAFARRRLAERRASPQWSDASVDAARAACRRYASDIDPYSFALGLQDPAGAAAGLRAARAAVRRGLRRATTDGIDRAKLAPLLAAIERGSAQLDRVRSAVAAGRYQDIVPAIDRFTTMTRRESALASRLGLRGCLRSPRS